MSAFKITTELDHTFPVVTIEGEIDLHTCPQLHQCLTEFISSGNRTLVLNLESVSYIDSTGLGVVAHAARQLGDTGVVRLVGAKPQVLKILELSGLMRKNFETYSSKADALGIAG
jgi:anti-anti-sigma factor